MAKFGLLFLNAGRWGDRQIVPAEWVAESTRNQLQSEEGGKTYGYWWWVKDDGGYVAMGWGGQAISVDPALELVAAGTSADPQATEKLFQGFADYRPSNEPLPPNPQAQAELKRLVAELARPEPSPVAELPAIAGRISGRIYDLDPNPLGLKSVSFDFPGGSTATTTVVESDGEYVMEIGLDGVDRLTGTGERGHMPGDENRFALRGRWSDERTFLLESHEMGRPIHSRGWIEFDEKNVSLTIDIRPLPRTIELSGRLRPEKTE
jgi:hypothetical protein